MQLIQYKPRCSHLEIISTSYTRFRHCAWNGVSGMFPDNYGRVSYPRCGFHLAGAGGHDNLTIYRNIWAVIKASLGHEKSSFALSSNGAFPCVTHSPANKQTKQVSTTSLAIQVECANTACIICLCQAALSTKYKPHQYQRLEQKDIKIISSCNILYLLNKTNWRRQHWKTVRFTVSTLKDRKKKIRWEVWFINSKTNLKLVT